MTKMTFILAFALFGAAACSGNNHSTNNEANNSNMEQNQNSKPNISMPAAISENPSMPGDEQIEEHLKNKGITDYKTTDNGLYYTVSKTGNGKHAGVGDFVEVHYTGKLLDGTVFDSSVERGEPIVFQLGVGRVIPGWDQGIPLFEIGGAGTLYIPSALAYGSRGAGNVIPPDAALEFDVEVISIMDEAAYKAYQTEMIAKQQKMQEEMAAEQNGIDEKLILDYIKANNLKAKKTDSGLYVVIDEQGSGAAAEAGKTVSVHYTGKLLNGTKFDSSVDRGEPFEFQLGAGRVIRGWDEGLAMFNVGGKGKLLIPSSLGYGARAAGSIPPNSVLVFDVELMDVK